jgi:tripartite-type tricarboxylate transporter receptor subunit TctC
MRSRCSDQFSAGPGNAGRAIERENILRRYLAAFCALVLAAPTATNASVDYPERTIKIIVPVAPGGGPDLAARIVAQKLSELVGKPVVVENRTGANGNLAGQAVAQAPPDGYTLLLATDNLIVVNPSLYKNMLFDPAKDLVPLTTVTSDSFVLSVNPSVPVTTLPEFVDYARRADPPLAYASAGIGSQHHLLMEMLNERAGIKMLHVPFRGGVPAVTATIAGTTQATFSGGASSAPLVASGMLRALGVSGSERAKSFPGVPAIAEYYPGYEGLVWSGLFAPASTPEPIVARLRALMRQILADPEIRGKLNSAGGLDPYFSTPEEFRALIARDIEKYGKLVKKIGISLDDAR